jgi:hypothetical protein
VVSLDSLLALVSCSGEPEKLASTRQRRDWVRGEVRCLMCARLIGWLLGARKHRESGERSLSDPITFFAYRSADTSQHVVPFTYHMCFRCADCGGTGAVDDVDYFSTYEELPVTAGDIQPIRRPPGRPRRVATGSAPPPTGLAQALTTLADEA